MTTVRNIIDDAQTLMGEVAGGPGVQVYDDDRMLLLFARAFNLVFKKYHWPNFCKWVRFAIVAGKPPTDTFLQVKDIDDFVFIRRDASERNIPRLPKGKNPYAITGTSLQFWDFLQQDDADYSGKKLQFYSASATDYVNVYARFHPLTTVDGDDNAQWDWDDEVALDRDMLVAAVAWMGFIGDDLNQTGAEVCKVLMEDRFATIVSKLSSHEIPLNDNSIPSTWEER